MKSIVITGSTRGIGRGLAESFLRLGCAVVVSGRSQASVDNATLPLVEVYGAERVLGQVCDVSREDQVQMLWDAAQAKFGRVDIWINNAGISHDSLPFWTVDTEKIHQVIEVNLLGLINGLRVAYRGMAAQGEGYIYNMEGLGSGKQVVKGLAFYESSKSAVTKLTQAAILDTEGSAVRIGYLSPGMVITDLLVRGEQSGEEWERKKRIYNILADRVETVAPYLAEKVLSNKRSGARIAWLTPWKSFTRFIKAPFVKRDLFSRED